MKIPPGYVIHTRIIIDYRKPIISPLTLAAWEVDNKRGRTRCLFILPRDLPVPDVTGDEAGIIVKSAEQANVPLIDA